jgi:hypothetical protein
MGSELVDWHQGTSLKKRVAAFQQLSLRQLTSHIRERTMVDAWFAMTTKRAKATIGIMAPTRPRIATGPSDI